MRANALTVVLLGALVAAGACSSSSNGGAGSSPDGGPANKPPVVPDDAGAPTTPPPVVDPSPTTPAGDDGSMLGWAPAPQMNDVSALPNRDSTIVYVPVVDGAVDYRVMTVPAGVTVTTDGDGHETVKGSHVFCAGYRQHNLPAGPLQVMRQIEVAGLTGATRLVIEAIDTACPFTGVVGSDHLDIKAPAQDVPDSDRVPFSVYTQAEVVAAYGGLIDNGHGAGPKLGSPAPPVSPKVLQRTTLKVTPVGNDAPPPTATLFDGFADQDQPKVIQATDPWNVKILQNKNWSFYAYEYDAAQVLMRDQRMHMVVADWSADVFASLIAYPRKPVQISATDYLHITYEVASDGSSRRYWWIGFCGADQPGQTIDADGKLMQQIRLTPFFMEADGDNPSLAGWNCFQMFPRNGFPYDLAPGGRPESEIRVMMNKPGNLPKSSVINLSPDQYKLSWSSPSWYRQQDGTGKLVAPLIDDQIVIAPNARYDVFLKRDRVVVYVNGQQRLCNDFASTPLTMAEGALGYGDVLYHSTAERGEFSSSYWDKTGQRYYLENTPYLDERVWDNLGYEEHAAIPSGGVTSFDESACYKHP